MSYVKLDRGILNSSLWADRNERDLFITALLLAVPQQIKRPIAALCVRALEPSGFIVPPGDYGFVEAAGIGIVNTALLSDMEAGLDALERLGQPDPHTRTPDNEGRRLVRVPGGFIVLNYDLYRSKDHTGAERQRRFRERQTETSNAVTPSRNGQTRDITQAEAEVKEEKKKNTPSALWETPPLGVTKEAWEDWRRVRKNKKAIESARSYKAADDALTKFKGGGFDPNVIVARSADNGWSDLWEPKGANGARASPGLFSRPRLDEI